MSDKELDNELLLKALILGVAEWRPSRVNTAGWGEVKIGGILWAQDVENGLPTKLSDPLLEALEEAVEKKRREAT